MEMQTLSGGGGVNGHVDKRSLAVDVQRSQALKKQRHDEEEMLRRSLRESERLRRLRRNGGGATGGPSVIGEENVGFDARADLATSGSAAAAAQRQPPAEPPTAASDVRDLLRQLDGAGVSVGAEVAGLAVSPRFDAVLRLAALAARGRLASPAPVTSDAVSAAASAAAAAAFADATAASAGAFAVDAAELRRILAGPHLRALLTAHDLTAPAFQKQPASVSAPASALAPASAPAPAPASSSASSIATAPLRKPKKGRAPQPGPQQVNSVDGPVEPQERQLFYQELVVEDGVQFKRVIMQKEDDMPLGATIKNEGESVVISRVVCGGACERTGLLREGDELLTVNDMELRGRNINEVYDILQRMSGQLTFIVLPASDYRPPTQSFGAITLRALFSYNPEEDFYNPCKELGLEFSMGDIIQVVNQDDPNWWQGHRDGDAATADGLAHIFPSPSFQQQRECISISLEAQDDDDDATSGRSCCPKRPGYSPARLESPQRRPFYERQGRLFPQPLRRRPLVLVGPPGVGRHELRVRLIEAEPSRFASAVAHTTRSRRPDEADGADYWFVDRGEFQRLRSQGLLIETSQIDGESYGTSVTSIQKIVDEGLVCVLTLQPENLQALRSHTAKLMPFTVFVSQPSTDKLRALQRKLATHSQHTPDPSDEELRGIVELGRRMEATYGHMFDFSVVHTDLAAAHNQLLGQVSRLEREPQWVPESWLHGGPVAQDADTLF